MLWSFSLLSLCVCLCLCRCHIFQISFFSKEGSFTQLNSLVYRDTHQPVSILPPFLDDSPATPCSHVSVHLHRLLLIPWHTPPDSLVSLPCLHLLLLKTEDSTLRAESHKIFTSLLLYVRADARVPLLILFLLIYLMLNSLIHQCLQSSLSSISPPNTVQEALTNPGQHLGIVDEMIALYHNHAFVPC